MRVHVRLWMFMADSFWTCVRTCIPAPKTAAHLVHIITWYGIARIVFQFIQYITLHIHTVSHFGAHILISLWWWMVLMCAQVREWCGKRPAGSQPLPGAHVPSMSCVWDTCAFQQATRLSFFTYTHTHTHLQPCINMCCECVCVCVCVCFGGGCCLCVFVYVLVCDHVYMFSRSSLRVLSEYACCRE